MNAGIRPGYSAAKVARNISNTQQEPAPPSEDTMIQSTYGGLDSDDSGDEGPTTERQATTSGRSTNVKEKGKFKVSVLFSHTLYLLIYVRRLLCP